MATTLRLLILAALAALLASCERAAPPPSPTGAFTVTATTAHAADALRAVAGARLAPAGPITLHVLMGEGVDPHTYKLTRADAARLAQARLVVAMGLHLEGKLADAFTPAPGQTLLSLGETLPTDRLLAADGAPDPHFWMEPGLFALAVNAVRDALAAADPAHADAYAAGARAFAAELDALDAYAKASFGSIPPGQRVLITSHDAFGYLGRRYGLDVHGVQGISTESEAGIRDVERLVELITARKVPAVFIESSVSRRTIDAVIDGCRARGHTVTVGGTLYSDALGAPGTYEGTYLGMMDHNITAITRALGGTAPEKGRLGKLGR